MDESDAIARYYDANTSKFLRLGGAGGTGAIHRAIWAPGVRNKRDALMYLNHLVASHINPLPSAAGTELRHLIDLGCGTGGTALFLAQTLGLRVTGVTLSPVQVNMANASATAGGIRDQAQFLTADFASLPPLPPADALCAIESFAHAHDAGAFFAMAAALLKPGGRLVLCDDFLADERPARAEPCLQRVRRGWHLNSLISLTECKTLAEQQGLTLLQDDNLSAWVRPFPAPLLWLLSNITRLPLNTPYWQNLSGGSALQVCGKMGWTEYHALVWERPGNAPKERGP
ncbi:MAG: methyltransferase domain-containing protein [Pseudomonadales bacterium]|nr:methyltransferase domain-containing protein [Pseudomonadales bacterium]